MYKYLKDESYYHELYDRLTIKECEEWVNSVNHISSRDKYKKAGSITGAFTEIGLYFKKGERYRNKSETIHKWMERDQDKDDRINNAIEPKGIRCLSCSHLMQVESKDLHTDINDKNDRVLFFFDCSNCNSRRAYWENGQEWEYKNPCPKCHANRTSVHNRKGNIITTAYNCPGCGQKETDTWDLDKREEVDPNFEANRRKYCISDKEGTDYISWTANLKEIAEWMKDHEENKEIYDAVAKIKKLTIVELQNHLNPAIKKAGYSKLDFDKPEAGRDLTVGFSLQDNKPGRQDRSSVYDLRRLLKKTLADTNWRLIADDINYKLGFLAGRLRGVEGEEALKALAEKMLKK
ncbi:MAG: hypothetical protein COV29_00185 [Candidatus Yanofskybacteria bacterium CG10_big_fil_rev_8_21_14_0_10_36_16]|uniref:Uncharacterized protein n=1 Tax=Candidatus Yanofskybacteria bacterium CG10_big_fil_rev_8_21_14_0_10_36_16 TaxID=1975096 RepID=A0A2J0Q8I2_9BACT|nr:MAG: hypothetical protein COV29_00185 [Candidatus Yanofskybacteria bacterium CG10_big_fil_rev_8_21_14_0_10_36_16]